MNGEKPKRGLTNGGLSAWAYVLIGLGVIFLVINLFNISLLRLWPLLLVAIGLTLLFGRASGGGAHTGQFAAPRAGVDEADIEVHLSVGQAQIRPLPASSDLLLDAELTYVGDIDFRAEGGRVSLRQASGSNLHWINPNNWFHNWDNGLPWLVSLAQDVPMRLALHGGAGKADVDLRLLDVTDLRLSAGVGEMAVTLPDSGTPYTADINSGVGELNIRLPEHTSLDLRLRGGVGEVTLETPRGGGVGVQVRTHGGISEVNLPRHFQRVAGGNSDFELGKTGTWETPGFASAPVQIVVDYQGGVGELRVR